MELTKDQKDFYETTRTRCRDEVTQINTTIKTEYTRLTQEIKRVNDLIATLEGRKQVIGQMYGSASEMIGNENDLDLSSPIAEGGELGDIDL